MVTTSYQYPQYLYVFQHDGESVQLPNGSWETPAAAWELKAACREETNGKGSTIQTADGETRIFASLIQLPKGTAKIPEGTQVIVTREDIERTLADFIPPVYPYEIELQNLVAVLECTSREMVPQRYQKMDRSKLAAEIQELKQLLG